MEQEQIGIYEARTRFTEIVRRIRDEGIEYLITRRGIPVAVMRQADRQFSTAATSQVLDRIKERKALLAKNGAFSSEGETTSKFSRDGLTANIQAGRKAQIDILQCRLPRTDDK